MIILLALILIAIVWPGFIKGCAKVFALLILLGLAAPYILPHVAPGATTSETAPEAP